MSGDRTARSPSRVRTMHSPRPASGPRGERRIDLLGSIVASSPPTVTTLNHISTSLPDPKEARIDVNELTMTRNHQHKASPMATTRPPISRRP